MIIDWSGSQPGVERSPGWESIFLWPSIGAGTIQLLGVLVTGEVLVFGVTSKEVLVSGASSKEVLVSGVTMTEAIRS